MSSLNNILEELQKRISTEGPYSLNWSGSFEDYLEIIKKEPKALRTSFQRLYNMILSFGTEEYEDCRKKIVHYKFFDDPFENGKDAIFGLDAYLMKLMNIIKSAAYKYGTEKRVLLLHGPVGSSKSTIARLMKKGLEYYSRTQEGALYSFEWVNVPKNFHDLENSPRENYVCPMHEEPLHVVLPRFRFGDNGRGGVGQGDGEPGQPLDGEGKQGDGQAGNEPGRHIREVELTLEELAEILAEALELPNIEPRGKKNIVAEKDRYTGIRRVGPESLRHFKRTFREALKRQVTSGQFDIKKPRVIPIRDDFRYRSWKTTSLPESNAVIIYMMDVSGSMWGEQKEIVRMEIFWIDTWLRYQYKGIKSRYIIHDAVAQEVDRETFFTTRENGGTVISSAYELCNKIIEKDYSPEEWNIYAFHFSDGDNWSTDDNKECAMILSEHLLPKVNMFGYGQVDSAYGSGDFIDFLADHNDLREALDMGVLRLSEIPEKESIYESIKDFFGKEEV